MAFFDDLGKKLSQAGQTTIQKTKELADIAKINSFISEEEGKIRLLYSSIGQKYFEQFAEDAHEILAEDVAGIKLAKEKIEQLKIEISNVKGVKKCVACSAEIPKNSMFCPSCGAKASVEVEPEAEVEQEVEPEPVQDIKCPHCEQTLKGDSSFCLFCGGKIAQ